MTTIVHTTPGLLPLAALTTFGASAKPATTSPIGLFGTGLKYAVAVLLRHDVPVRLWRGETEYEFYLRPLDLRGTEFRQVAMRQRRGLLARWTSRTLPFTTQLGRNWSLWQAYRELYANTLDESGSTDALASGDPLPKMAHDRTIVAVGPSDDYAAEHARRGETFLPSAGKPWDGTTSVLVDKQPSSHVYWRGMRAMDLPQERPAMFRWCVMTPLELTEDRTIKYAFQASAAVARHVLTSDDEHLVREVISAPENRWESTLDWDYSGVVPSETFRAVVAKRRARGSYVSLGAGAYWDRYAPGGASDASVHWAARAATLLRRSRWSDAAEIMRANATDLADALEAWATAHQED